MLHGPHASHFTEGGSADPEANGALAAVIRKAKSLGVPKDNIEACIKRVSALYHSPRIISLLTLPQAVAKGNNANAQAITYEAMSGTVGIVM